MNEMPMNSLSFTAFRLTFHNSIPSASSLGLGLLGFHSVFLLTMLSQGDLTGSNSLLADRSEHVKVSAAV
jgi:hypothetical protein